MNNTTGVSIIISSYNYGRFLNDCIDSALSQTYTYTEVIVVDDASSDNSRDIIASYGSRIVPVLRERNEGGRATYNAACRLSERDVILFLDSDDMLAPTAVEKAVELFSDPDVVKVHWPLWKTDVRGRKTGRLDPGSPLPDGDFREHVIDDGPFGYSFPSTSGNAYSRRFLEKALPVPSGAYGDAYLAVWALVLGKVRAVAQPQGYYRTHGHNNWGGARFDQRLEKDLRHAEICCKEVSDYYRRKGKTVDIEEWKKTSWHHRMYLSVQEIKDCIPDGDVFVLADEGNWATGGSVAGRSALPFPEHNCEYWGRPPDDATAIGELERQRKAGASFLVVAWQAFWWLEYYRDLQTYLLSHFRRVLENERLVVFDIRT